MTPQAWLTMAEGWSWDRGDERIVNGLCEALRSALEDKRDMDTYDARWFALHEELDAAKAAIARVRAMHDPTNERFCPQCGWDTEPAGLPHPDPCPTVAILDREEY